MNKKKKPLSLGFIGGALNSAVGYSHYVAISMDGHWSLETGCFSKDEKENLLTASAYNIPDTKLYSDWKKMIQNEKDNIDAVCVLTPTPLHHEMVTYCLENNVAVICEKALAANVKDAEDVLQIQKQNNAFLAVTYNYTGYPMLRELRAIIQNGKLGRISHFQVEMPQEGFIRTDQSGTPTAPQPWRLADTIIPTIHLDLGVHIHQILYYLLEKNPTRVYSKESTHGHFNDIIDDVKAICEYPDQINGNIWFSKCAIGYRNGLNIRIFGDKGSAEWHQMNPEELRLSYACGKREILDRGSSWSCISKQSRFERFKPGHPAGFLEAFANLYSDIAYALISHKETGRHNSEEIFGAELSIQGLKFLEAMTYSAKNNSSKDIRNEYK